MKQQLNSKELKECVGGATAIEYGLEDSLASVVLILFSKGLALPAIPTLPTSPTLPTYSPVVPYSPIIW